MTNSEGALGGSTWVRLPAGAKRREFLSKDDWALPPAKPIRIKKSSACEEGDTSPGHAGQETEQGANLSDLHDASIPSQQENKRDAGEGGPTSGALQDADKGPAPESGGGGNLGQKKKKKKKGECQVQQGAADAATSCTRQQGQVGSSSSHASTHQQRQALPYSLSATSGPVGSTQDWSAVYTVMMRNVPFKWTQYDLLEELSRTGFLGSFDFLYLPIDPDTDSNRGYAFINFASSACAHRFKVSFEDRQLNPLDSRKLVSVVPALRQGYAANHAYYAQAKVSRGDYSRRPLFLREDCGLPTDRQVMHTDEQHGAIYMNVAAPPIISGGTQHPHAAMSINAAAFPTTSEGTEHVHTVSRALSGLRSALGLSLSEPPSRYCTSCGSKGQAHGSFCTSCGNSMRCDLDTDAIECL
eukprot:gnl/TRDRNA2_/TRDRNA2_81269_c0_seq1.p1 gnl/TRDRNA2_/TRDRNA2_81269_c0~~gnl/TRDRNA2_/TRDRNA2_81269_c0_seq1.p1  ORF type:complete len:413 (-),score=53.16 gnl/TRDRNA2_/TRDRNA2_81269_c0_seq1:408-1646(-)